MDIRYIPGVTNSAADALSRYPHVQRPETDLTPIEDLVEVCLITAAAEIDSDIIDAIKAAYADDGLFGPVIANPERYPAYSLQDGLLYHKAWLCIPSDKTVREVLLTTYHDDQNHFGISKTQNNLSRDFLWPGITNDVEMYVRSCDSCTQNKSSTQAPAGFLHPLPVPTNQFLEIALDFVGPLPESDGYNCILVMTDRLTNYVLIEPTTTTATAPDIASLFYKTCYRRFGLPTGITSDRDKLFVSRFWQELFNKLKVHLRMSTAFHPETDGSSERSNKTAIEALRHYVNTRQDDCAEHLIKVEAVMNNSVNATTGRSPTELLYGMHLLLIPHPADTSSVIPAITEFLDKINESVQIVKDRHVIAKTRQAIQVNRRRRPEPEYKVGDLVYLNTTNLHLRVKQQGRSAKFLPRFIGPFPILKVTPETSSYKLDLPAMYQIHPVFHAKLLKPATLNDPIRFPAREPPRPGPVFTNDDGKGDNYEVAYIRDHRDMAHRREYYIHWKGWPSSDDEWIHEDDMDSPDLIMEYLSSIPTRKPMQRTRGRRGARAEHDSGGSRSHSGNPLG